MSIFETEFTSPTLGRLSIEGVVAGIGAYIRNDPKRFYKIIVGTDSNGTHPTVFVSAVTVWKVGGGAVYFWTRHGAGRTLYTLRDRIWHEALSSVTLAQEMRSRLRDELGDDLFWDGNEVHVDAGADGATREFLGGITGLVKGYDFVPVTKPDAFVASAIADRHT